MNQGDSFDPEEPARQEHPGAPQPIIIVQRGRSTWGRELLLLILLVSTAGYLFYQEYRGPAVIVRSMTPNDRREVDAVATAPVARGEVVLRASDANGNGDDSPASRDRDEPRAADPPAASPPRPEDPGRPGDGVLASDEALPAARPADRDDAPRPGGDEDGEVRTAASEEPEFRSPFDLPPKADGANAPDEPRRASAVIVWDQDRPRQAAGLAPDEPEDEPGDRIGLGRDRPDDRDLARDRGRGRARELDREPSLQTLAQRRLFLQTLGLTIRQYGRGAGPHIDNLCREFQVPLPSAISRIDQEYGPDLFLRMADVEETVTRLRLAGAPEHYLLEQLSTQMTRAIGVRHGPRDRMEARVFAARKLLAIPLPDGLPEQAAFRAAAGR